MFTINNTVNVKALFTYRFMCEVTEPGYGCEVFTTIKSNKSLGNMMFIGDSPSTGLMPLAGMIMQNSPQETTFIALAGSSFPNLSFDTYEMSSGNKQLVYSTSPSFVVESYECSSTYSTENFTEPTLFPGLLLLEISNIVSDYSNNRFSFVSIDAYSAPYPFGYRQHLTNQSIEYSATLLIPPVVNSLPVYGCPTGSLSLNLPYTPVEPTMLSIEYLPLTPYSVIVKIHATHPYGVTSILVDTDNYGGKDIIQGTLIDGLWLFEATSLNIPNRLNLFPKLTLISFTYSKIFMENSILNKDFDLLPYLPTESLLMFSVTDITHFEFLNNDLNLDSTVYTEVENSLFFNITLMDPTKLPLITIGGFGQNEDIFDFLIPAQTLTGNLIFYIYGFGGYITQDDIAGFIGSNGTLRVVSSGELAEEIERYRVFKDTIAGLAVAPTQVATIPLPDTALFEAPIVQLV
eukprot:gene16144-19209_t